MERSYVYYLSPMIEQYEILNFKAFRNWQVQYSFIHGIKVAVK
jgi:hypothetical protein